MSGPELHDMGSKGLNLNSLPRATAGSLSPFGQKLRKLRFDHFMRIYDLAKDLKVSSSSVSAWETGRREVSEEEILKIGHVFSLSDSEIANLREAAELSKRHVTIVPHSIEARQLANQIKKRINELSSETIQTILSHLKWTPTRPLRWDMKVPRRSVQEIENVAHIVRRISKTDDTQPFDIVKFYDKLLDSTFFHFLQNDVIENTAFEIWDDLEMPKDTRGMTIMYPPHIVISNSVYEDAANGGYAGRWIMAHELGHLLLLHGFDNGAANSLNARGPEYLGPHLGDGVTTLPFQPPKKMKKIPRDQSAEAQADDFAGELLMPREYCGTMLAHNISRSYGVSISNAKRRLRFIWRRRTILH